MTRESRPVKAALTSARSEDTTRHRLRRLGYVLRPARRDPILDRLERVGVRTIPLNRLRPASGHRYGACPRCGRWDGLWVDPDGTWGTLCGCAAAGGLDPIDLAFFLRGVA